MLSKKSVVEVTFPRSKVSLQCKVSLGVDSLQQNEIINLFSADCQQIVSQITVSHFLVHKYYCKGKIFATSNIQSCDYCLIWVSLTRRVMDSIAKYEQCLTVLCFVEAVRCISTGYIRRFTFILQGLALISHKTYYLRSQIFQIFQIKWQIYPIHYLYNIMYIVEVAPDSPLRLQYF